jgi:competence protein ComEC
MIVLASMRWAQGLGWVLLAWCGGIALQLQQAALWPFGAYAALGVLALGLAWGLRVVRAKRLGSSLTGLRLLLGGLVWAMLAFAVTGLHALSRAELMNPALEGQDLDVVGVVQAMPQRQDLGWRFRFGIEQAWQVDKSGLARAL